MAENASSIRAGRAYVEVGADVKEAEKKLGNFKSGLDSLKKGLGEESQFGGFFKILAGTGAVAGLGLAARLLADMTKKAVELKDAFDAGAKSAGQVAEELIQSIPVLGQIRQAGLSIRELFTGDAAALAKVKAQADALIGAVQIRKKIEKEAADANKEALATMKELRREIDLIGLKSPILEITRSMQDRARARDAALAVFEADKKRADELSKAGVEVKDAQGQSRGVVSLETLQKEKKAAEEILKTRKDELDTVLALRRAREAEIANNGVTGYGAYKPPNLFDTPLKQAQDKYAQAEAAVKLPKEAIDFINQGVEAAVAQAGKNLREKLSLGTQKARAEITQLFSKFGGDLASFFVEGIRRQFLAAQQKIIEAENRAIDDYEDEVARRFQRGRQLTQTFDPAERLKADKTELRTLRDGYNISAETFGRALRQSFEEFAQSKVQNFQSQATDLDLLRRAGRLAPSEYERRVRDLDRATRSDFTKEGLLTPDLESIRRQIEQAGVVFKVASTSNPAAITNALAFGGVNGNKGIDAVAVNTAQMREDIRKLVDRVLKGGPGLIFQ